MSESKKPRLWQVFVSSFRAWFGVQNKDNLERDFTHGSASDFVIVGLIFTLLFILALWGIVQFVMSMATH